MPDTPCTRHAGLQIAKTAPVCAACYSEVRRENGRLLESLQSRAADIAGLDAELKVARQALADFVDWHGAVHVGECPGDDTCCCAGKAANDAVNAVLADWPVAARCDDLAAPTPDGGAS